MKSENENLSSPQNKQNPCGYTSRAERLVFSAEEITHLIADTLQKDCTFRFRAKGWSMSPLIKDNDILTLTKPVSKALTIGDVVAFFGKDQQDKKLTVHRIVGSSRGLYRMKGDALKIYDGGLIPLDQILGKVINIERNGQGKNLGIGLAAPLFALLSRLNIPAIFFSSKHMLRKVFQD